MFKLPCAHVMLDNRDGNDASGKACNKICPDFRKTMDDIAHERVADNLEVTTCRRKTDSIRCSCHVAANNIPHCCANNGGVPRKDEQCPSTIQETEYDTEDDDAHVVKEDLCEKPNINANKTCRSSI